MPAPDNENPEPLDPMRRDTDEMIAHHLGSISFWLSQISEDLRHFRNAFDEDRE